MNLFHRHLLVLPLVVLAPGARAQERDACLQRTVAVNVVDENEALVSGLTASNFRAQAGGKAVRVGTMAEGRPRRILVVLDASGSMTDNEEKWKISWTLAEHAVVFAPDPAPVSMLVFDHKVRLKTAFGEQRQVILKQLADLASKYESKTPTWPFPVASRGTDHPGNRGSQPEATTHLWDAVREAFATMGPFETGDVIYVISDGGDTASGADYREVETRLAQSGARMFSLVPLIEHPGSFFVGDERMAAAKLTQLSESSGGHTLTWRTASDKFALNKLGDRLRPFYDTMAHFYRLEIDLPQAVEKPSGWRLELTGAVSPAGKLKVRYPKRLFPCAALEARKP